MPTFEHNINFGEPFRKVREHVVRHKTVYSFGAGVAIAGITGLIIGGRCAGIPRVPDTAVTTVFARPLFLFSNHNKMVNVVAVVTNEGRGHPGFPVICKETLEYFPNQYKAAEWLGAYPSVMSGHLKGKLSDVCGYHFERISAIPAIPA